MPTLDSAALAFALPKLAELEQHAVARLTENLAQWEATLQYRSLFAPTRRSLHVGPVQRAQHYARTSFRQRLQKRALATGVNVPRAHPVGFEVRSSFSVRLTRRRSQTVELVWWYVVPVEKLAGAPDLYCGPLSSDDLDSEVRRLEVSLHEPCDGQRIVVLAAPSWDDAAVHATIDLGLARLRVWGVVGFGLADLTKKRLKSVSDVSPWGDWALELLHPLTNQLLRQWLEGQLAYKKTVQLLRTEEAIHLSVRHWRLLGVAQALAQEQPDRYSFEPSPGNQCLQVVS